MPIHMRLVPHGLHQQLHVKTVFHFLCIFAHGPIQSNSLSLLPLALCPQARTSEVTEEEKEKKIWVYPWPVWALCCMSSEPVKWPDHTKINSNSQTHKKWNIVLICMSLLTHNVIWQYTLAAQGPYNKTMPLGCDTGWACVSMLVP